MKHCRKFFTPLFCRDQRSGTGSACKCNSAEKTFCLAGSLNVLRDVLLLGQSQTKLQCMLPLVWINLKWLMMVRQFLSGHQCQKMKWRWAVASYCCCTSPRQAARHHVLAGAAGQGQASGGTSRASHVLCPHPPPALPFQKDVTALASWCRARTRASWQQSITPHNLLIRRWHGSCCFSC